MKLKEEGIRRLKGILAITATTLLVYLGFRYILPLILPFLIAYFLAWITRPVTEFLYRRLKIPRIVGGTFSILILTGAAGAGIFYLCKTLFLQIIALIRNIPIYADAAAAKLDHICSHCDGVLGFAAGTVRDAVDDHLKQTADRIRTVVIPGMTRQTISFAIDVLAVIGVILIVLVAAVLIAKDLPNFRKKYETNRVYQEMHLVTGRLAEAGIAYLRCQLILMSMVAVVCVLGLTIIHNDYALLAGIGIALADALPVIGSGLILIPWSIIVLFNGNIFSAAILMTTFLVCQVIREILEPKLIGNRIGIKPLFTLIAMYVGVRLFSIPGFILGPIGLVIIIAVVRVIHEKTAASEGQHEKQGVYEED